LEIHRARFEFVRGGGSLEVVVEEFYEEWEKIYGKNIYPWGQFNVCF